MNWKIGQKLVCVDDTTIVSVFTGLKMPNKDEIVTYDGETGTGDSIFLKEYNYTHSGFKNPGGRFCMARKCFRPLLGDDAKESLINSFKEIAETSDCPMVPEIETA